MTLRPIVGLTMIEKDSPMAETILVVGSKPIDQQTVIWNLLKADYQVRYATSNSSAIRIISVETPSAILLAAESSEAEEICLWIRRVAPATPLLVLGREDNTAIRVKLFQADADDYVLEPCDLAELIARIRSAIRRSRKGLTGS
jgi:DNA-binding response OmpR family regulator